jgi:general secretion pathway protein G
MGKKRLRMELVLLSIPVLPLAGLLIAHVVTDVLLPPSAGYTYDELYSQTHLRMQRLVEALDRHRLQHGVYPSTGQSLGPVLMYFPKFKKIPPDPWGHAFIYASPGPMGQGFVLTSLGADGKQGGTGEHTDIVYVQETPGPFRIF